MNRTNPSAIRWGRATALAGAALILALSPPDAAVAAPQLTIIDPGGSLPSRARVSGDGSALTYRTPSQLMLWDDGPLVEVAQGDELSTFVAGGRAPVTSDALLITYDVEGPSNSFLASSRWDAGVEASLPGLDLVGDPWVGARAMDASADGTAIVGHVDFVVPLKWIGTTPSLLPRLAGDAFGFAVAISADASVIAGGSYSPNAWTAVRWEGGGAPIPLDLPIGSTIGEIGDLSADGSTVVGVVETSEGPRIARWVGTSIEWLGSLGPGDAGDTSVSGDGSVVVGVSDARPFIWIEGGLMRELNGYLHDSTAADLGSFVIDEASVSDSGQILGGIGHFSLAEDGYPVDVPTAFVLDLGAAPTPVPLAPALGSIGLALSLSLTTIGRLRAR